jgi:hypothetical protein
MKTLKTILGIGILFTGMLLSSAAYSATQDYEKDYPVQNINGIDLTLACELYIKQGDTESLKIEADEDVLDKIKVKQKDSIVYIKTDKKEYDMDDWDVEIYLTVKTLNSIDIGGAVKLENEGTLKSSKLSIDVSGAADIELNIEVEKLLADLSGAVNADLEGKADYVVIDMSGASKVDAEDLISRAVYLDFSGFGKADVHASEVLKVEMSGMGVVRYSGNPGRINTESSGLGVIKSK